MKANVKALISENKEASEIYRLRMSILDDCNTVVPCNLYEFFKEYSKNVKRGHVFSSDDFLPINFETGKPICLMYSGGAESSFIKYNFGDAVDLITGVNFYDYNKPHYKREFQLNLLGMVLGYRTILLGIGSLGHKVNEYMYEYTPDFFSLWNATFPTKIHTPIRWMDKDEIYSKLFSKNVNFNWCDNCEDNIPCGECWSCFEAYCVYWCLNKPYPYPFNSDNFRKKYEEIKTNPSYDPCDTNNMIFELEKKYNLSFSNIF